MLLQHSAQHFARGQARNIAYEHHAAQAFVGCQLRVHPGGELGGVDGSARRDCGNDRFTVDPIRNTKHRTVFDGRMVVQHRLDFGGRDLETTHFDHLFEAVGDP